MEPDQPGPSGGEDAEATGPAVWAARRAAWRAAGEAARQGASAPPPPPPPGAGAGGVPAMSPPPRRPVIDPEATYESLLMGGAPFPVPIPLDEMVDFLVDVWVEEGLY